MATNSGPHTAIIQDVKNNGPIPRGWHWRLHNNRIQYCRSPDFPNLGLQYQHPLTMTSRYETEFPAEKLRDTYPGVSHPPPYQSTFFKWEPKMNYWHALYDGLKLSGVEVTLQQFENSRRQLISADRKAILSKDPTPEFLYHPLDRENFHILEGEQKMYLLCKSLKHSLVIVCPQRTNQNNWSMVYCTNDTLRPAVQARWSVGEQELYQPVYIGCLPVSATEFTWYNIVPSNEKHLAIWKSMWTMPMLTKEYLARFNFPNKRYCEFIKDKDDVLFEWTIVALQKLMSLGAEIPENQTGNWIHQYGRHLYRTGRRDDGDGRRPIAQHFLFNKSKPYSGLNPTYHELLGWILGSPDDSRTRACTRKRDEAIIAMHEYLAAARDGKFPGEDSEKVKKWKKKWATLREPYGHLLAGWTESDEFFDDKDGDEDDSNDG